MRKSKSGYQLKHYNELKMTGSFSAATVEELTETAVDMSLGRLGTDHVTTVSVGDLHLYVVRHHDTGERRPLTKNSTARVYETTMQKINDRPIRDGRFRVESIGIDNLGSRTMSVTLLGHLVGVEPPDHAITAPLNTADISAIRNTLINAHDHVQILGRMVGGHAFGFGEASFSSPRNGDFDNLISIGFFNDPRDIKA